MTYLPCIEIEPKDNQQANAAIIWLHGLGATGDDFASLVPQLKLDGLKNSQDEDINIRFIFPHAPSIPLTVNGGISMPAWYDILNMDVEREINQGHLSVSVKQITDLIERELERGVPSESIILAGFSQGGAVAYEAALNFPRPLAGLLALSTYIANKENLKPSEFVKNMPIYVYHGKQDHVVPEILAKNALQHLENLKLDAVYKTYDMQHSVCLSQIRDMSLDIRAMLMVKA